MKLSYFICLVAGMLCSAERLPDLATFRDISNDVSKTPVFIEDFETPHAEWKYGKGCRIVPSQGINGNAALLCERTNANDYECAVARIKLKVKPGCIYDVSAMYRTENMSPKARILTPAIEFRAGGKYLSMNNPTNNPQPSDKWAKSLNYFVATEENELILRLFYNDTGKIYFDDIRIEEKGTNVGIMYPLAPRESLLDDKGTVEFKAYVWESTPATRADFLLLLDLNGVKKTATLDQQGNARVQFGELPDGNYTCTAYMLNLKAKTIIMKRSFMFRRMSTLKQTVATDEYQRVLIDGKPVLPIGIYDTWIRTEADLKRIADGGFNFVLTYTPNALNIQKTMNDTARLSYGNNPPGKGSEQWRQNVKRSLDTLAKYNLKLLGASDDKVFDHPVVLGTYTADEISISHIDRLQKVRESFLRFHPGKLVVALTANSSDYVPFSQVVDGLGIDVYPVETRQSNNMMLIRHSLEETRRTGKPIMFVPQAFNWGAYKDDRPYSTYMTPTDEQLRAMVLLPVIYDVKWFCFYSYTGIWELMEKKNPGEAARFWQVVVRNAKLLKELEPWILSLEKAPTVTVNDVNKTHVDAKAFLANGKVCVVVTSCGPGEAKAEITVPGKTRLRSRFGKIKNLGNGKYRFSGQDITSDILME